MIAPKNPSRFGAKTGMSTPPPEVQEAEASQGPLDSESQPAPEMPQETAGPGPTVDEASEAVAPTQEATAQVASGSWLPWWAWLLVLGGGGLLAYSYLGSDAEKNPPDEDEDEEEEEEEEEEELEDEPAEEPVEEPVEPADGEEEE